MNFRDSVAEEAVSMPPAGLLLVESRSIPGRSNGIRDSYPRFYLVISGHAHWEVAGRRYSMGPDTLCHVPANQPHHQETRANESVLMYVIRYRSELLPQAVCSQLTALGMISLDLTTNANHARAVRALFQEMLFEQEARQGDWEALLQSRLIDLTVRLLRFARRRGRIDQPSLESCNDSSDRVARYVVRLNSQFFRQQTMEEAARSCDLSRRQFTTLFRKVTGQSWRQYLLSLRLKHAGKLLLETESSVLAVAFESGFEDVSHFHHTFKSAYGCSPLEYREQHRVPLLDRVHLKESGRGNSSQPSAGFKFRGMKGWFWTTEQYLDEIAVLSSLKMNFLMNCCGSVVVPRASEPGCIEWWKPMSKADQQAYSRIIAACIKNGITFCFSLQPRLASSRQLDAGNKSDLDALTQHFAWAQSQGVQWFSLCLVGTGWGSGGPAEAGVIHANLVNQVFSQLRVQHANAQFVLCPIVCWGDGNNLEHHAYLEALAREMDPDVYVFWYGDSIVTPRVTRVAAENFKNVVRHRIFLWDNYPVNDANPTLHLGPLRGRDADLCEVVDGYLSNPMCTQNQINRLPLATCADYAFNPHSYDPGRSIAHAILRFGKTKAQQATLRDLVEAYPGFIIAGGGTGSNPVRAKLAGILAGPDREVAAQEFIRRIENIASRLRKLFPGKYPATKATIQEDIDWMRHQLNQIEIRSQ